MKMEGTDGTQENLRAASVNLEWMDGCCLKTAGEGAVKSKGE